MSSFHMTQKENNVDGVLSNDPDMSLIDAIYSRRSVRGFLDKKIPEGDLQRIFEISQQAPSNCNVQPWKVYVATGALRDKISQKMVENTKAQIPPEQDYEYRGDFEGDYRRRQIDCAVKLYNNMGIARDDKPGRMAALLRNFEFFDAPYMAFIGMDPKFGATVALDIGMYAQTFMLTLVSFGLHSCAMGSMRNYPAMIREEFGITDDTKILFGIAFGYEDTSVPANATIIDRDPVASNVVIKR
ncbi:MAG: nitroreductase [Cellvibrionaceae bacterium]